MRVAIKAESGPHRGMKAKHPTHRTHQGLWLAFALMGCGGSPPPTVAEPEAQALACSAFQAERAGACVYALEEEASCLEGQAAACTVAAHAYMSGEGVAADETHAAELYHRACRGDDAEGCGDLAELREYGRGGPEDPTEASRLYSLACELGDGLSCTRFATLLSEGRGVDQDVTRAVSLFERACGEGEMSGCAYLGAAYADGTGVERNTQHAIELYTRACDAQVGFACNNLGTMLEFNTEVERDTARAMALYEQSCSLGTAWGCFNVGRTYGEGNVMPPDLERARVRLDTACEQGAPPACRLAEFLDAPGPTAEQTATSCTQPARLTLGREVTGTTEGATNSLTATCGLTAASPDRVYALSITRPTRVRVDLFSAFDGVVHIRSACSVDAGSQVACNDDVPGDAGGAAERHSGLEVDLPRGSYFVVVDGYGAGAAGTYRLLVSRAVAP